MSSNSQSLYCIHPWRAAAVVLAMVGLTGLQHARATITTLGNVTPTPPAAGGNINAFFLVGDSSDGSLNVTPSSPATPINVIGSSNNAILADDPNAVGTAAFSGFGSNFTLGNDLILGNGGRGSLSISALSRVTAAGNMVFANAVGSSGRLFVNDLGTSAITHGTMFIGNRGTALVQVLTGGSVYTDVATIGSFATGSGTVTVSGNESLWDQSGAMTVGSAGRGYVQVVSQARMETGAVTIASAATGVGEATVSGTGSSWEVNGALLTGVAGVGKLEVNLGGRLANTGAASLATTAGGEGTALVSGQGSVWNTGTSLTVGAAGSGILRVFSGGRVNAANTILASTATSRGEISVDGSGTVFDVTGTLDVGNVAAAEGFMSVTGGGVLNTTGIMRVAASSELFLSGGRVNAGGGLTNSGLIQGGGRINGAVTNAAGAEMRSRIGTSIIFGSTLANTGLVEVSGGEIEVMGVATNVGDIDIRNGAARFAGGLNNNNGSQLAAVGGNVDVFGNVTNAVGGQIVVGGGATAVFHDALTNNGQLFVMPGADVLMLENLSFSASSLLNFQLNGEASQNEQNPVEVTGLATLAGQLKVQLTDGFAPQAGDTFDLLTSATGISGTFGTESLPALAPGLGWDVNYTANSLSLAVVSGPGNYQGDFDGDGDVDGADLTEWRQGFGKTTGAIQGDGDADADGDVDGADFLTWQRQLGSGPPATATAAAVPEPAAAVLLAMALVGAAAPARRRLR